IRSPPCSPALPGADRISSRPTSAFPRSWIAGSWCARPKPTASATGSSRCSSRGAWRTPTSFGGSCSPSGGFGSSMTGNRESKPRLPNGRSRSGGRRERRGSGAAEGRRRGALGPAAVRRGSDPQVRGGHRQSEEVLRGASRRQVPDRGGGPGAESADRADRPDPGHSHPGPEVALAHAQDHRRPLEHRARARGFGRPAAGLSLSTEELTMERESRGGRAFLEIDQFRIELDEAEETLRAIRRGEVDALVVDEQRGDKVYYLKSPDRTFRLMIEAMGQGAVTLTPEGVVLYCNVCFARMLKMPSDAVIGASLGSFLTAAGRELFEALLRKGENGQGEVELQAADRMRVPAYLALSSLWLDE